jgi:hypothetical protein
MVQAQATEPVPAAPALVPVPAVVQEPAPVEETAAVSVSEPARARARAVPALDSDSPAGATEPGSA